MKIDDEVACAQAEYLHRNVVPAVTSSLLGACVIVYGFWDAVPQRHLILWLVALALFVAVRIVAWTRFRGVELTPNVAQRFFQSALLGTLVNSLLWSAGAYFFYPVGSMGQQLLFNFGLMTLAVGAMFSQGSHFPSFVTFLLPFSLTSIYIQSTRDISTPAFLYGTILFVPSVMLFGWRVNRLLIKSLQLRFENLALVEQLKAQKAVAEKATVAKSRFLAAASHDLRQPMHALNLYLGTLASAGLPEAKRAVLAKARQCAQTMDEMFRSLLDISRLDASVTRVNMQSLALAEILERIATEFEPQAHAKGLRLRVAPCSAWVCSDPALLDRILRNLVTNAVRYTERGSILVGCRHLSDSVRVEVHDTGPGIAPDQQRAVFEEFYQIANRNRDAAQGIGLGLPIVQRLALLLGTNVELISQPNRGSTFRMLLPIVPAAEGPKQQEMRPVEEVDLTGRLILVVDDELSIRDAAGALLESWGCVVILAGSGSEAKKLLIESAEVPDALICDYRLHDGETGSEVLTMLREEFNVDIPALLITGETAIPESDTMMSDMLVMHKPLQDHALRSALNRLITVS